MELDRRSLLLAAGGLLAAGVTACGTGDDAPAAVAIGAATSPRTAPASTAATAVAAVEHLTAGLYGALGATPGNLAFSPLSVAVALAMTVNGAAGETRRQMLDVLGARRLGGLDEGMSALLAHLRSLAVDEQEGEDRLRVVLDLADAIFAQAGYPYEKPFLDALASDYAAELETVDFVGDSEGARGAVNSWTSDHTGGLIPQILPPGSVDATTRLVLVNALHLLASWDVPFGDPQPAPFHLPSGQTVSVPTMSGGMAHGYRRGAGWQSARLPYRRAGRSGLAMTVVLPDHGLGEVERLVRRHGVDRLLPHDKGLAHVTMPTWSVTTGASLAAILAALGMTDAFGLQADFSRITHAESLSISDVVHQAVVKVDQHGTEAAAATAVTVVASAAERVDADLVLDRPFLFVIHDEARRTPLFVGRVADPRPA